MGRLTQSQSAPSNPSTAAWYLYDGAGHRVEQTVQHTGSSSTATTYYLLGGLEEVHTDGSTQTTSYTKYYPNGLGLNTTSDASGSGIRYLASDGLASVQAAFDADDSVTATQLHSPYRSLVPIEYAVRLQPEEDPDILDEDIAREHSDAGWDAFTTHWNDVKIGGIPAWREGPPYPSGGPWRLLLQLSNSQLPFDIVFGAYGIAYAFLAADGMSGTFLWQC